MLHWRPGFITAFRRRWDAVVGRSYINTWMQCGEMQGVAEIGDARYQRRRRECLFAHLRAPNMECLGARLMDWWLLVIAMMMRFRYIGMYSSTGLCLCRNDVNRTGEGRVIITRLLRCLCLDIFFPPSPPPFLLKDGAIINIASPSFPPPQFRCDHKCMVRRKG